jgi:hypothetical protein
MKRKGLTSSTVDSLCVTENTRALVSVVKFVKQIRALKQSVFDLIQTEESSNLLIKIS